MTENCLFGAQADADHRRRLIGRLGGLIGLERAVHGPAGLLLGINEGAPHKRSSLRHYIHRRTEEQEAKNLNVAAE